MKRRKIIIICSVILTMTILVACNSSNKKENPTEEKKSESYSFEQTDIIDSEYEEHSTEYGEFSTFSPSTTHTEIYK